MIYVEIKLLNYVHFFIDITELKTIKYLLKTYKISFYEFN